MMYTKSILKKETMNTMMVKNKRTNKQNDLLQIIKIKGLTMTYTKMN